ncbi:MAG: LytR family transcriptional regulator [Actinomycetaceae bacterium]|nr:LytR family transcriptional regulator [Actinomycetaceae bacterium]
MAKTNNDHTGVKRAPTHQRRRRIHTKLRVAGLAMLALVLAFGSTATTMYANLQKRITQHVIEEYIIATDRPTENQAPLDQKDGQPINILVLGTDIEVEGSMRSDTAMIVHISAGRDRLDVVSIPRDTLVHIPPCVLGDGSRSSHQFDAMFNSAFDTGTWRGGNVATAATCSLQTVEDLTGIYIDGFIVLNFDSFKTVVDILGGIEMCFTEDINDRDAQITLDAGCHVLDGEQALAVARMRGSVGDGSDIGRISRQHQVVTAILDTVFADGLLSDPAQLYSLLGSVTPYLDMSEGIGDIQWLAGLAYSLRNIEKENVNFMTMPFVYVGPRVAPAYSAQKVWQALINDEPVPESALVADIAPPIIINATEEEITEFVGAVGSGVETG